VETRGLTLEEVDRVFDGVKHSNVADLGEIKKGIVQVDPLAVIEDKHGHGMKVTEERA
jgi:hypothetical protein